MSRFARLAGSLCRVFASGIVAASAIVTLLAFPLGAQEHPNVARGFAADKAYQIGDLDHINLFNGNLVISIPLGQTFPVGGGLSFGLSLTYNSNAWDFEQHIDVTNAEYTQALPGLKFNAGLGWLVTLGQLNPPTTSTNQTGHDVYLGPDGGEHTFYDTLHEGESPAKGVLYTRDGSYLRLRNVTGGREIDFPDGTIHRFDASNRLIQIRSRFVTATSPTDVVNVSYTANDWTVTTNLAGPTGTVTRTQRIHFRAGLGSYPKLVDYVEVPVAGSAPPARYTFSYALKSIQRPCPHNDQLADGGLPVQAAVPLLVSLTRPDGSQFTMPETDYVTTAEGVQCAEPWNGAIQATTLPTFGRLEWDYQRYSFPTDSSTRPFRQRSAGVAHRRLRSSPTDPGAFLWTYTTAISPFSIGFAAEELINTVTDPLNNLTENRFSIYSKVRLPSESGSSLFEYGLPISHKVSDGTGRYLSTRTFDASGHLLRSTYARYELDPSSTIPVLEERSRLNQRSASTETIYHDDPGVGCNAPPAVANPCRYATSDSSDFDGLGHYRTTATGGNFGSGDVRTSVTRFNPTRGTFPGTFVPLLSSEPWVLGTYDRMTESEGGNTSRVDTCFDSATGFLLRKRILKGTSPGSDDVLMVMSKDGVGNLITEEAYGGDGGGLDTSSPLCSAPLLSPSSFRTDYTYQYAVRASAQAKNAAGGAPGDLAFRSLDLSIDPGTGLPTESRDSVGWRTAYQYDGLGRVTQAKPLAGPVAGPVGAWSRYVYNRALSGSQPATVDVQTCPSTSTTCTAPLTQSQLVFDYLGRLTKERTKMPDGTWSKKVTTYNANGWKDFVSEQQSDSLNDGQLVGTKFLGYDPFGRPGTLKPADGAAHQITFNYVGVRQVDRLAKVATSYDTTTGNATETTVTTSEVSDRQGRLLQVIEPNGISTRYGYDIGNRLSRVCQAANVSGTTCGQERLFTYDNRGFLTSEKHPEKGAGGNGTVTYANYDAHGHAQSKVDGPSNLILTYDRADRLTKVEELPVNLPKRPLKAFTFGTTASDLGKVAKTERWNYRMLGANLNTALITETYQYLGRDGRVSQRDTGMTFQGNPGEQFTQSMTYHELGFLDGQSYPNCVPTATFTACTSGARSVSNVYTEGRLTAVTNFTGTVPGQATNVGLTYHPNGQLNQLAHGNGVLTTYGLDTNSLPRPASITSVKGTTTLWDTGPYKYDGSGNIWKIGTSWFEYDSLSRLVTGAVFPGALGTGTQQKQTSAFDNFGNLQSLTTQIGTAMPTTRLTTTSPTTNRLTSPSAYDAAGNLTGWNGAVYDYDGLNQLAHYLSGTEEWFYVYTADDERVWSFKPAQGANLRFDRWTLRGLDGQVLREYPITGYSWTNWEDTIYRDGKLLANYLSNSQRRNFDLDHLGTPRLITNTGGSLTSYHVFYPFGEEATLSTQDTERHRFTGHERDLNNQTGANPAADDLDYMHARFCSPVTGRFLSVDPMAGKLEMPQSWNRYSYALNNPLRYFDPNGKDAEEPGLFDMLYSFFSSLFERKAPPPKYATSEGAQALVDEEGLLTSDQAAQLTPGNENTQYQRGLNDSAALGAAGLTFLGVQYGEAKVFEVVSRIAESSALVRAASGLTREQQASVDAITAGLAKGRFPQGAGTRSLFNGILEARSANGARVAFRVTGSRIEILAKFNKGTQAAVLAILKKLKK